MRKKYNTPHRSRVVKTRLSEDEYADFTARLAPYGISQSEFLRQAIRRATIRPVVHVSSVNDELLSAVGKLTAEYGRIGGNLNQIARYLNEYGVPYNTLSGEVRAAISDLAVLKYEVLKKVGDAVGNTQAYPVVEDEWMNHLLLQEDDFNFEQERLANAYAQLPLLRKQILKLLFVRDLKVKEIAKMLNCSPNFVSDQKRRALEALRRKLDEGGDENG